MSSVRWHKVFKDLWHNKTRTLLVVLSIAVGVFAVGAIASIRVVLQRDMAVSFHRGNPKSAAIFTEPFEEKVLTDLRQMDQVKDVAARNSLRVRVEVAPGEWRNLQLFAIPDFDAMRVDMVFPISGQWPPARGEILFERGSLSVIAAQVGTSLRIEMPDKEQQDLQVVGMAYDPVQYPVTLSGIPYGYISMDTLEWLGQPRKLNEVRFSVAENPQDRVHIQQVIDKVQDRLHDGGVQVFGSYLPVPGKHPGDDAVQTLMLLLGVIGLLSLVLSSFLIINTVSAVLTEQVRYIGMMKAVGARQYQLTGMYLGMVLAYGGLALCVAIPIGMVVARWFLGFMAGLMNFDVTSQGIPLNVLALELILGLVFPLLVSLGPVLKGTRVTVREAINDYGVGQAGERRGVLERALERVTLLPRPLLLSLRNTFRSKGRLLRTLVTLMLGGAMFISVLNLRQSLLTAMEGYMRHYNYDIEMNLQAPYEKGRLEQEALALEGVTAVESWAVSPATRIYDDGRVSSTYRLLALPPKTDFLRPEILEGRWLEPGDTNAIVVDLAVLKSEADITVGSEVLIKSAGKQTAWHVVGVTRGALTEQNWYLNYDHYNRIYNGEGRVSTLQVRLDRQDIKFQNEVEEQLRSRLEVADIQVGDTRTTGRIRSMLEGQFTLIITFLVMMSLLLAVVGGLGLTGTMSINVIERTREIGVLRAVGASSGAVIRLVLAESILIGLVSWLGGTLLAIPLSKALATGAGNAFLQTPLTYEFSGIADGIWLVLVILLSALSSSLPAWRAASLSVKEVLSYQ